MKSCSLLSVSSNREQRQKNMERDEENEIRRKRAAAWQIRGDRAISSPTSTGTSSSISSLTQTKKHGYFKTHHIPVPVQDPNIVRTPYLAGLPYPYRPAVPVLHRSQTNGHMQKQKLVGKGKEEIDRSAFGCLPDSLLCLIVSFLPAKEAVRTSILSQRWRNLWKFSPRFCFDLPNLVVNSAHDMERDLVCYTRIIDKVLSSHQCELTSCYITNVKTDFRNVGRKVQQWINKKRIKQLTITYQECLIFKVGLLMNDVFPASMFSCGSLHILELNKYKLTSADPFEKCTNLKIIKLNSVDLSHQTLTKIIFHCSFLEKLSLCGCIGIKKLDICHCDNLKFLELRNLSFEEINIHAKGLTILVLDDVLCSPTHLVIESPNVQVFQTFCYDPKGYLETAGVLGQCSGLFGYPSISLQFIETVKVLTTCLDLNHMRHNVILASIFRMCCCLQTLCITSTNVDTDVMSYLGLKVAFPQFTFWERELYACISYCLEEVWIRGFLGKEQEIRFVSYLIRSAGVMKKIVIHCDDECCIKGAIATKGLLSLPRGSANVSIVLLPPLKCYLKPELDDQFEYWMTSLK